MDNDKNLPSASKLKTEEKTRPPSKQLTPKVKPEDIKPNKKYRNYNGKLIESNDARLYTKEEKAALVDKYCDLIADGESQRTASKLVGLPWQTLYKWLATDSDWDARYLRARRARGELRNEQALEEAWKADNDQQSDKYWQIQRLKVQTIQWVAGRESGPETRDVRVNGKIEHLIQPALQIGNAILTDKDTYQTKKVEQSQEVIDGEAVDVTPASPLLPSSDTEKDE